MDINHYLLMNHKLVTTRYRDTTSPRARWQQLMGVSSQSLPERGGVTGGHRARHTADVTSTSQLHTGPSRPVPLGPRRGLAWLAGIAVGGVGLSALYSRTGMGLPCPFLQLTGWWCPLCGGTRMGAALLRGDVVAAFWFNPIALVALVGATLVGLGWLVQLLGGPAVRPPAILRRVSYSTWMKTLGIALIVFTILRNVLR